MGFGDELMCTGEVKRAQQSDPRPVVVLDRYGNPRHHALFENNPRIAYVRGGANQEIVNGSDARPYIAGKTPTYWQWRYYRPEPGEIYFTEAEYRFGKERNGYILVEPFVKGSTGNKDWGFERWCALRTRLNGLMLAQVGPPGTRPLPGARMFITNTFREACAVLAHSRAFVGTEGGLHHAAAALGIPAVVIFGGFISPDTTGYSFQRSLFSGVVACGSRLPCQHCREAMHKITPEMVEQQLREII